MDFSWPVAGSWALAVCMGITILGWWLVRRDRRESDLRRELRAALRAENAAIREYNAMTRNGTAEEAVLAAKAVVEARKRVECIRRAIGISLFAVLVSALPTLAGCRTARPEAQERIVLLDSHIRIVAPGETVPDYPAGEGRWWLATPTGLASLVPQFPRLAGEGEEDAE